MTAAELAVKNSPTAARWIASAFNVIHNVLPYLTADKPSDIAKLNDDVDFMESFGIVQNQFHFKLADRVSLYSKLILLQYRFGLMQRYCNSFEKIAEDKDKHPDGSVPFAFSYPLKSFDDGPTFDGNIYFTPEYPKLGPKRQIYVVVHELAHYVDPPASDMQGPNIQGITDIAHETAERDKYDKLSPESAMKNAFTYSQFALQCHHNLDLRMDPVNQ
jgi:hypothetical protein